MSNNNLLNTTQHNRRAQKQPATARSNQTQLRSKEATENRKNAAAHNGDKRSVFQQQQLHQPRQPHLKQHQRNQPSRQQQQQQQQRVATASPQPHRTTLRTPVTEMQHVATKETPEHLRRPSTQIQQTNKQTTVPTATATATTHTHTHTPHHRCSVQIHTNWHTNTYST